MEGFIKPHYGYLSMYNLTAAAALPWVSMKTYANSQNV
jgi:hypothetical protein